MKSLSLWKCAANTKNLKSATAKKELGADQQETHIAIQFVLLV